jgi:hypothetical protein
MKLLLLALALLLAGCAPSSAVVTPSYNPLPPAAFSPVAGSAGERVGLLGQPVVALSSDGSVRGDPSPENRTTPSIPPSPRETPPAPRTTPKPSTGPVGHIVPPYVAIRGTATWYRHSAGHAAAAASLRALLGPNWRGMRVRVCKSVSTYQRCISVVLDDFEASTRPGRVIDLAASDFARLAPLGAGVLSVTVEER